MDVGLDLFAEAVIVVYLTDPKQVRSDLYAYFYVNNAYERLMEQGMRYQADIDRLQKNIASRKNFKDDGGDGSYLMVKTNLNQWTLALAKIELTLAILRALYCSKKP